MSVWREVGGRALVAVVVAATLLLLARAAHASFTASRLLGEDARLTVANDGSARFELAITYRVLAGALREVDLQDIGADSLEPVAEVRAEDGSTQTAAVALDGDRAHLVFDAKGLKKGTWAVRLRGSVRLSPIPDGALFRLVWSTPLAPEGIDGARVVFDLPAGATEPRAVRVDVAPGDLDNQNALGVLATLRRTSDRDELELVRLHVARGEAARWAVRVDPKALSSVPHPASRPPPMRAAPLAARSWVGPAIVAALCGSFFSLLARTKRARAAEIGAASVVPLGWLFAGLFMGGAVWLEIDRKLTLAGVCVALALLTLTFRTTAREVHPGRGVWRVVELVPLVRRDPFDATCALGAAVALFAIIALVVLARCLRALDEMAPVFVALDAAALVPLFFTGTQPSPDRLSRALLSELRVRLADLATTIWGRVPREGGEPLELRLVAMPRAPIPGLCGIEVAIAWDRSGLAWAPRWHVLVRSRAESAAHGKLLADEDAPTSREPGRAPEERVFRWVCEGEPDALVRRLTLALEERRSAPARPHAGPERRRASHKRVRIAVGSSASLG
jgi:hypothetical protein